MTSWIPLAERSMSAGFQSAGIRHGREANLDPFLNVDLFRMSQPTFPPHPHAGFSAVTYMLPESPGAFVNRDSFGDHSRIRPGSVHWTQAGAGMMHEEVPESPGTECRGFQIFVDLKNKAAEPRAFHAAVEEIPSLSNQGATVRVVAGEHAGRCSPLTDLQTPVTLLDVSLDPGAKVELEVARANTFVFSIGGVAACAGVTLSGLGVLLLGRSHDSIELEAGPAHPWRGAVFAGLPLEQPVMWSGPFAMTSAAELEAAVQRYRRGAMGQLTPSF
ncbi:MAG: pirin family protein [Planctomycetota bacterium]